MKRRHPASEHIHKDATSPHFGTQTEVSTLPVSDELPATEVKDEQLKRALEIAKLKRELSFGNWLEWAKAVGPLATSIGIIFTIVIGILQQRQSLRSREDERFERSVTRLGSQQPSERLTGLIGLQLFLRAGEGSRQESALNFIINAAVIEQDRTVREALLDSLDKLGVLQISKAALDAALITARDRNRVLLRHTRDEYFFKKIPSSGEWPSDPPLVVPIGNPPDEERDALLASARALAALVRAGAYAADLSQIYCVECVFSSADKPAQLADTNFDTAFLSRAHFERADLTRSSFNNADLGLTYFTNANLTEAKLTQDVGITPWGVVEAEAANTTLALPGALFTCANLTNADFSGRTIFTVLYSDPVIGAQGDHFMGADLTGAKLDSFQLLLGFPEELFAAKDDKLFDPFSYFPIKAVQWSGPFDPLPSFAKASKYRLYNVSTGSNFQFSASFDSATYWDWVLHMRDLYGARNLDKAVLAPGFRAHYMQNLALYGVRLGTANCER